MCCAGQESSKDSGKSDDGEITAAKEAIAAAKNAEQEIS